MRYTVMAIKNETFENHYGIEMTEETIVEEIECGNDAKAQEYAEELAEKYREIDGDYKVFVHYLHEDSPCYLNPIIGHSPVAESWI